MSTETHEELEAAGGAGDPLDAPTGDAPAGESNGAPDWLAEADDELREWATSKGIKDPVEALKSYRGAERGMTEAQQNAARMEGRLAELMQRQEQADAGQGPQLSPEEQEIAAYVTRAGELFDEGQIDGKQFAIAMMNAGRAQGRLDAEQAIGQRVGPVEEHMTTAAMTTAVREMSGTYDDFVELSDEVMQLVNAKPKLYASPEGIQAAYGLVKSRHQRAAAAEGRKAARTETLTESSKSDQAMAQEASAAIIKELDAVRGTPGRDPLG